MLSIASPFKWLIHYSFPYGSLFHVGASYHPRNCIGFIASHKEPRIQVYHPHWGNFAQEFNCSNWNSLIFASSCNEVNTFTCVDTAIFTASYTMNLRKLANAKICCHVTNVKIWMEHLISFRTHQCFFHFRTLHVMVKWNFGILCFPQIIGISTTKQLGNCILMLLYRE